jgi:hypothetical protein
MAVNPKTERLILQRYDEVRHDELQTVACEIVGKEFSVSSPTVARIVKRRHAPIEQLTSSDFEIRAIPIREPPRPQTNDLLDSNGRYELTREERWLILPDTQVPYHDQRTLDAVLQYAAANRWDGCIQLGDYTSVPDGAQTTQGKPRGKDSCKST